MNLKYIFVFLAGPCWAHSLSLHLPDSESTTISSSPIAESDTSIFAQKIGDSSSTSNATSVKGNLNTLLPNPMTIITQINSTVNMLVNKLNSTLSSTGLTQLLGVFQNITSNKPTGKFLLEDGDHFVGNISEILKNRSDPEKVSNFTQEDENMVEGALRDVRSAIMQLRKINNENADPSTEKPVAHIDPEENRERRSVNVSEKVNPDTQKDSDQARSGFQSQNSFPTFARQGSYSVRNETVGIMSEVRRVFNTVITEPFRNFIEGMRRRLPTAIVSA